MCYTWPLSGLWQCSGHVSILSLLDLSAAINTIDYGILIQRLHTTFGCSGLVHLVFKLSHSLFLLVMNRLHLLWYVVCHRVQFWPLLYTLCTHSLSALSFVSQATHTISMQMTPSFTARVFPQTSQLLSIVWETVLKMSLSGWVTVRCRWMMIKPNSYCHWYQV